MSRVLNDSPYLYGFHDPGGEHIMGEKGVFGWVLFTEALGANPGDQSGGDYSRWADQGFGIIVRLNNGYEPHGTIPYSAAYGGFAQRCGNFVRNSRGCHIWIIGNEMNYALERPGVLLDRSTNPPRIADPGETILPGMYASCYRQCRSAIRAIGGHENDQVIVGAVAPWNPHTAYEGNPQGDWVKYFEDILTILGPANCDGISIHAYTHGADSKLVCTDAFMDRPFQNRQYNFRCYRDFMNAIPLSMRHLPVYLTEANQDDAWRDENIGWVQQAYDEIDHWNKQPGNQIIRAVILYRWPRNWDKWGIDGKSGVIDDFRQALAHKHDWESVLQSKPTGAHVVEQPLAETGKATEGANTQAEVSTMSNTPQTAATQTQPTIDTSPIRFDATGKTAKGLFAAFYRQYGLDILGYPITDEYVSPDSGLKTQDWQRLILEEYEGKIRLRLAGEEAVALREQTATLREQIGRLERQVAELRSGATSPAAPAIVDITGQLPRDASRFVERQMADIQFIVINHTAVRPDVGADRVASAHLARWPGIVGQYFVTGDGAIQQTNPINQAVTADQAWIYNGINIYVAGNFDDAIPADAQIEALAQLCAWLLSARGLPETAVRGASEFIVTHSPGLQWQQGARWKDRLLERIRAVPAGFPHVGPGPSQPTDESELGLWQVQIDQLEAQIAEMQTQLTSSEQQRIGLQQQLDALLTGESATGAPPEPQLTDVSPQLPRKDGALKKRPLGQIAYLVFNHTAVDPSVSVERIAAAHQERWGAILYQYLITADGAVLQTNALDEVVDLQQTWIAQGVNIAISGNFTSDVPVDAQIRAAAALSAWLMHEFDIPIENLKGASEFVVTQSPGIQWMQGKRWKDALLVALSEAQQSAGPVPQTPSAGETAALLALRAQISQLQVALNKGRVSISALQQERDRLLAQMREPASDSTNLQKQVQTLNTQIVALSGEKDALAQQVQQAENDRTHLTGQLAALQAEKTALTQQLRDFEAQIARLQAQPSPTPATTTGTGKVQAPDIVDLVDKLARHATLKYETRARSKVTHIAVHHSAAPANVTAERIAQYHVGKDWPGMGYHFYIQPDGTICQANRIETVSYHAYKQNHYSLGICLAGNFVNAALPTPRQIEQAGHLIAWLMQELGIPLANVLGHKEFPENQTTCPGSDWSTGQAWKRTVQQRIQAVQAGQVAPTARAIGHYMLFWQRADDWAEEDWSAATNYIARFRPTAGFSLKDAQNADYVTIVGGVAGVSYESELTLRAAGARVERLDGADFRETKRILDELASSGRRFRTFDI